MGLGLRILSQKNMQSVPNDCKHPVRVNQVVDDAPVEVCLWCKKVVGIYWRPDLD